MHFAGKHSGLAEIILPDYALSKHILLLFQTSKDEMKNEKNNMCISQSS